MSPANDAPTYHFGDFRLDVANRQLWRGAARVDLRGRYFDTLALLVREHGQLVAKDRFFDDLWGDVTERAEVTPRRKRDVVGPIGLVATD